MKYLEVGNYLKLKVCNPLPSVDHNTLCLDMEDPNVNAVAEVEDEETEGCRLFIVSSSSSVSIVTTK